MAQLAQFINGLGLGEADVKRLLAMCIDEEIDSETLLTLDRDDLKVGRPQTYYGQLRESVLV